MRYSTFLASIVLSGCGMLNATNREERAMLALVFRRGAVEGISQDGRIHRFDPASLNEGPEGRRTITSTGEIATIAFSPDGGFLAVADRANVVRAGPVDGALEAMAQAASPVPGLAVAPSGSSIAVLNAEDVITIYGEGRAGATITGGKDHFSPAMAFSPDGKTLAVGLLNLDGPPGPTIRLYNVGDGSHIRSFGPTGVITALAFSPEGKSLAFAGSPGNSHNDPTFVGISNIQDGATMAEWQDPKAHQAIRSLAFDGSLMVCAPFHGPLRAFKLNHGRLAPR